MCHKRSCWYSRRQLRDSRLCEYMTSSTKPPKCITCCTVVTGPKHGHGQPVNHSATEPPHVWIRLCKATCVQFQRDDISVFAARARAPHYSCRSISAAGVGAQQQTSRTPLLLSIDGTDGRTDTGPIHRPCSAGSVKNHGAERRLTACRSWAWRRRRWLQVSAGAVTAPTTASPSPARPSRTWCAPAAPATAGRTWHRRRRRRAGSTPPSWTSGRRAETPAWSHAAWNRAPVSNSTTAICKYNRLGYT